MAQASITSASGYDDYRRIAAEYRTCILRCQQANDQLAASEAEFREITKAVGDGEADTPPVACQINEVVAELSQRELEVFGLIGSGLSTQQIAKRLGIATSSVETYRERLKAKLKIDSGAALNRQAVLWLSR
jgi:DNA-binding NarL/FixJ family response regulator